MNLICKLKGLLNIGTAAAAPAAPSRVAAVAAPVIESSNDKRARLLEEWNFNCSSVVAAELIKDFGFFQEELDDHARAANNY
jgi:hypothetical protein